MTLPSRGARESIATIRKNGWCLRPSFFKRIRTAITPQSSVVRGQWSLVRGHRTPRTTDDGQRTNHQPPFGPFPLFFFFSSLSRFFFSSAFSFELSRLPVSP